MTIIIAIINIFICFTLSKVFSPYNSGFRFYSYASVAFFVLTIIVGSITEPHIMIVALMIFLALYILGRREYMDIFVKELVLQVNGDKDIDLIYVADLQFDVKDYIFDEAFDNTINLINQQKADILLFGGDYLNQRENLDAVIAKFMMINLENFKYGAFAVMGNHDYVDYSGMVAAFEKIGIKCLENDYQKIDELDLNLVGVVDTWCNDPDNLILSKIDQPLNTTVVLAHQPDEVERLEGYYDLMLSGHYHAGQLNFIFGIQLNALIAKYIYGFFLVNGRRLYVTSGAGGSIGRYRYSPYIRYLARPEITKIKLKEKNDKEII